MNIHNTDVIFIVYLVENGQWALAKFADDWELVIDHEHLHATFEECRESLETSGERIRKGWSR